MNNISATEFKTNVIDPYYKMIYNYILVRTGYNQEITEDLTQEVFIKIWKNYFKFNNKKASLKTWVFNITRNHLIDHYRKRKLRHQSIDNTYNLSSNVNLEKEIESQENFQKIQRLINMLPEKDKELLTLRYINEFNIKEIAEVTGKTYTGTKMALSRAKKKLIKILKKEGYEF